MQILSLGTLVCVFLFAFSAECLAGENAKITVDPSKSEGEINPFIYGQFLEHIVHSIDLGLHAEMLTERSFEYRGTESPLHPLKGWNVIAGKWGEADGKAIQTEISGLAGIYVGDPNWKDYDLELKIKKRAGTGTLWIMFRIEEKGSGYIWDIGGPFGTASTLSTRSQERGAMRTIEKAPMAAKEGGWRHIRVALRGNHVACEIDGATIHAVEDDSHPSGSIGVAMLAASGEVKDVKVTSSDGDILFEDSFSELPPPEGAPDIGKGWEAVGFEPGTVKASRDDENPFNSSYSLQLDIPPEHRTPVGVRQINVPAQKGREYIGYIYLRGDGFTGKANVVWGSADASLTYTEAALEGIGTEWKKVPFSLKPEATDPNAVISFMFEGNGKVWLDQASLLPVDIDPKLPLRKELVKLAAALKPSLIRWPGGCFASIYYWKDGIGPVDQRPTMPIFDWEAVGGVDPNNFGTDEFIGFCRQVGAEPFLVTNLAAGPEYAADWVEYCNGDVSTPMGALRARNGHPEPYNVKYWSIDNEQWIMDSHDYGRQACESVEAMLERDPGLVFWLVGCHPGNLDFINGVLEEAGKYCDYLSIHNYWGGEYEKLMASNIEIEEWIQKVDDRIKQIVPDKKVWIGFDEWNPGDTQYKCGLAAAAFLNSMERLNHMVGMTAPALWMRHNTISKAWDNALIQFDQTRHFVSPTYLAMKMYSERFVPVRVASEVVCSGYTVEGRDTEVPYLDVLASKDPGEGRIVLKVVNRNKDADITTSIRLKLPDGSQLRPTAEVATLNADALDAKNTLDDPNRVKIAETSIDNVSGKFDYTFPAHSATVIVVRLVM